MQYCQFFNNGSLYRYIGIHFKLSRYFSQIRNSCIKIRIQIILLNENCYIERTLRNLLLYFIGFHQFFLLRKCLGVQFLYWVVSVVLKWAVRNECQVSIKIVSLRAVEGNVNKIEPFEINCLCLCCRIFRKQPTHNNYTFYFQQHPYLIPSEF